MNRAVRALCMALAGLTAGPACRPTPVDTPPFTRISDAYRQDRYGAFQALVRAWTHAVSENDLDAVVAFYAPDAAIELDRPASGPDVPQAVERWLYDVESVLTGPADFEVGGDLAWGAIRILVVSRDGSRRAGLMSLVLREDLGGWRIRSQLLALR